MAQYIPVLKEDFEKTKEKLEILRLGEFGKNNYAVYGKNNQIDVSDGTRYFDFTELTDSLSQEEIDAINYLLFSDELQLNASSIQYRGEGIFSSCAIFVEDGRYLMGIHYFESNGIPVSLQSRGDYAEELGDNYWILFCFMETA